MTVCAATTPPCSTQVSGLGKCSGFRGWVLGFRFVLPQHGRTPHRRQAHASPRPALKRAATQNDRQQQEAHGAPDLARAALAPTCRCRGCKSRGRSAACNHRGRRKRACARPGDSPASVLPACCHSVWHQTRAATRQPAAARAEKSTRARSHTHANSTQTWVRAHRRPRPRRWGRSAENASDAPVTRPATASCAATRARDARRALSANRPCSCSHGPSHGMTQSVA